MRVILPASVQAPSSEEQSSRERRSSFQLKATRHRLTAESEYLVLVMVGLPARGKSFISKKLERFLWWRGTAVQIFNVGERRREQLDGTEHSASFFAASNRSVREALAQGVLEEMVAWLRTPATPKLPDGVRQSLSLIHI